MFYTHKRKRCVFNILIQEIVADPENRGMKVIQHTENIRAFVFKTLHPWGGEDQYHFWAKNDDDLFKQMFYYLEKGGELSYPQPSLN